MSASDRRPDQSTRGSAIKVTLHQPQVASARKIKLGEENSLASKMKTLDLTKRKDNISKKHVGFSTEGIEPQPPEQLKDICMSTKCAHSESVEEINCRSNGFVNSKQKWKSCLSPTGSSEKTVDPGAPLTTIMFRIAQSNSSSSSWPRACSALTSDPKQSRPRRLNVNSIRNSAREARNKKNTNIKRAKTVSDAALYGRSLRALHQITHVEAIAASELERKRQDWLDNEGRRKDIERQQLQNKVDLFIAKVEKDKSNWITEQSKMARVSIASDITPANNN